MKIAVSGFIANPFSYVIFRNIFKRTLKRSFSQMQIGINSKLFPKTKSNKVFHVNASIIKKDSVTVEASKIVTDIFDPRFINMRSNTLESVI